MISALQPLYPQYAMQLPGQHITGLQKLRQDAFAQFIQQGLPSLRVEEWKYTNLAPIARQTYQFAQPDDQGSVQMPAALFHSTRLVFINGYFNKKLSHITHPESVHVGSLAEALEKSDPVLINHLKAHPPLNHSSIDALNLSCAADGVLIILPANYQAGMIECCFFNTHKAEKIIIQPRNIILCGENSQATFVEHYCGDAEAANLTNSITELYLEKSAVVRHIKLQTEPPQAVHMGQLYVKHQQESHLQSYVLSFGGKLVRNQIHSLLDAPKAKTELYGLFIAKDHQHMDQHTTIEHVKPECTSYEFYRGILLDHARGIFSGNVIAHPNAAKTIARQINNNLLLSPHAEIDTKPELQIYTDDIQCSHGATVGKLDEQALFYLRARGIDREEAMNLLIYTFAAEVLKSIEDLEMRDILQQQIPNSLSPILMGERAGVRGLEK